MKLRALVVLLAVLGLTVGSLAVSGEAAPSTGEQGSVSIVDFAFSPRRLAVNVGDAVTWTNNGARPHTSSAKGGVWDSGILVTGDSFTFTFDSSGRFQYRCNIHTDMKGVILVRP
jgi:plastocyanin